MNENTIGIFYDHKKNEVYFYKNGINQGLAFKNVPVGLIPSIDIWFVYGTVEINKINFPEGYSHI